MPVTLFTRLYYSRAVHYEAVTTKGGGCVVTGCDGDRGCYRMIVNVQSIPLNLVVPQIKRGKKLKVLTISVLETMGVGMYNAF